MSSPVLLLPESTAPCRPTASPEAAHAAAGPKSERAAAPIARMSGFQGPPPALVGGTKQSTQVQPQLLPQHICPVLFCPHSAVCTNVGAVHAAALRGSCRGSSTVLSYGLRPQTKADCTERTGIYWRTSSWTNHTRTHTHAHKNTHIHNKQPLS